MNNNNLAYKIKEYIDNRRTISFENLCFNFELSEPDMKIIINNLEVNNHIRIVNSPCTLDCNTCSTCEEETKERLTNSTIIISLVLNV